MSTINLHTFCRKLAGGVKYRSRLLISALYRHIWLLKLKISIGSKSPIIGDAAAVVSLTSHGRRIRHAHYTIQTIGNGSCRPRRLILWISHSDAHLITPELRSLQRRGLEILLTEDFGSHKKYYPYCAAEPSEREAGVPLVTADDDVLYQAQWLRELIDVAATTLHPAIVAHRSHKMKLVNGKIAPYDSWGMGSGTLEPSYANVATGVGGVLYPPEFVEQIDKVWNTQFMELAASADDLWLNSRGLLLGIPTKQVNRVPAKVVEHHPDLAASLSMHNVIGGNNDIVIGLVYTPEMVALIHSETAQTREISGER